MSVVNVNASQAEPFMWGQIVRALGVCNVKKLCGGCKGLGVDPMLKVYQGALKSCGVNTGVL